MGTFERLLCISAQQAIQLGWFRFTHIECKLPSGRMFKYNMEDYPFRPFSTPEQIDALCCELIKAKYRYCDWDRAHPKTNAEVEIFDTVKAWMLGWVARAQRVQAEAEAGERAEPGAAADPPRTFASRSS